MTPIQIIALGYVAGRRDERDPTTSRRLTVDLRKISEPMRQRIRQGGMTMIETRKVYEAKIGQFTITAEVGYGETIILSYDSEDGIEVSIRMTAEEAGQVANDLAAASLAAEQEAGQTPTGPPY